jgi:hypothetical protein
MANLFNDPVWLRLLDFGTTAFLATLLIVLAWMLLLRKDRAHEALDAEFRAQIVAAQREIAAALDNHLTTIGQNQARTAQALDLIVSHLLREARGGHHAR